MKRKGIILLSAAAGILIMGFLLMEFKPESIIENPEKVRLEWFVYEGEEIAADEIRVLEIVKKFEARRSLKDFFPTRTEDAKIQMILEDGSKVKHIMLGEPDIWYEAVDGTGYEIQNAEELVKELESLFVK